MSYKGRFITFFIVLIINLCYMAFYYIRDGHVSWFEFLGLPAMLLLAWYFGKQYDLSQYYLKKYLQQQKELEASYVELQQSKNELLSLFENSNAFLWSVDLATREVIVSKGIENMVGCIQEDFHNYFEFWASFFYPDDMDIVEHQYNELLSAKPSRCQIRIFTNNGEVKWVEIHGNPLLDSSGKVVKLTGVAYDITERKQLEDQMKHIAYHDHLTGLPNRYLLNDYLQRYLAFCKRNNTNLAVMFLDLDNFKMINDRFGHDVGDALLQQAGKRLTDSVREEDVSARLGGDEFIILLNDVDKEQAKGIAERLIMAFNKPFLINDQTCTISTSIGISLYPQDTQDGELLIQLADTAMYSAKKLGKNMYCFYQDALDSESAL
ncbi:sensor domain-containing diguanylate cyclase [Bacillus benzoevorans]|uniref:Diguanylate cyclase (GGDEF)-like protein/PAS domain S-box-containing protein n=1 Tax=Bacillus benzoevorans TaxID=1456 RepID=A0A7X0HUS9_9BACI|nr:sensor domain-containing diguanylate cyclase [Bacillus benzoevorans]MBB6447277.1 diguanylate cyclase (GGDEF)-like protein/PAS domain S-box-containing protein [Bacillus benzoevorans]